MGTILGTSANDTLSGTAGSDFIDGGAGADTMSGAAGDDVYAVDDANDAVIENPGEGSDRVNTLVSYSLGANVENLWLVGTGDTSGVGNALGNILWGNAGANSLDGQAGNDYLDGGAGADTLIGGAGNDAYWVDNPGDVVVEQPGDGTDIVYSSLANYTLGPDVENLTLTAGAGNIDGTGNAADNALTGNEGANVLTGADGNDTLDGGAGPDTLIGGAGNDLYRVDDAGDMVSEAGGEGTETVTSTLAAYTLTANVENLNLGGSYFTTTNLSGTGNDLANFLRGNQGDNALDGAGGDDTLNGGDGSDTLTGGEGHDLFYLTLGESGTDTVTDLASGDTIELCGTIFSGLVTVGDGSGLANGDVALGVAGGRTLLHIGTDAAPGADMTMVLNGVYEAEDFHAAGFYLNYDTNHAPVYGNTLGDQHAVQGLQYSFQLPPQTFTDADGDPLTLTADMLDADWEYVSWPGWLGFDPATGLLTGTPGQGDAGTFLVIVTATDPSGASTAAVFELIVDPAINGTAAADNLAGTAGDDVMFGLGGNDTLAAAAGNDRLDGGTGNDTMLGGGGNDLYVVDSAADKVFETLTASSAVDAGGSDTVESAVSWTLGGFVEALRLTGSANLAGTGNALANAIEGNDGNNALDGKAGADTLSGGAGNDLYVVDNLGDTIVEAPGQGTDSVNVAIAGAGGTFTLGAGVENATLTNSVAFRLAGNALANQLTGNAAANTLTGYDGNDTLNGAAGADTLYGGAGDDLYVVDNAGDRVFETATPAATIDLGGTDTVSSSVTFTLGSYLERLSLTGSGAIDGTGNALNNGLAGNGAANRLAGLDGNDTLDGGGGNDTLTGGNGGDVLIGGAGNDVLTGGTGADHFVFGTALGTANVDKVMDFARAEGDRMELSSAIFAALGGGVDASELRSGAGATTALTAAQHLIYNSSTGYLYYDADGAGGAAAKLFAIVDLGGVATSHPASLAASDFAMLA